MNDRVPFVASLQNPTDANFRASDVPDDVEVTVANLVAADGVSSKGLLYRKRGTSPRAGVHMMHPRTDQSQNYNILPLVEAGYMVLGRASRWPNNDSATVHENLVIDVAAGLHRLRQEGCEKLALLGNSGGGTMAAFYQSQARKPKGERLTHTPAGDLLDLNEHDLPVADAIVMVGSHIGQGRLLGKMIDPSVADEGDPLSVDPSLDMYDPINGFVTPPASSRFDHAFLARYREAQMDRVRRIDARARQLCDRQRSAASRAKPASGSEARVLEREARAGHLLIVHRTTADPAMVDLNIDPDDRTVASYVSDRPDLENYGVNGFGRIVTPKAWLSTWSAISTNAHTFECLAEISEPLLVIHYAGDVGTRLCEAQQMIERSGSADKTLHIVRGANHYGFEIKADGSNGERSSEAKKVIRSWLLDRCPL